MAYFKIMRETEKNTFYGVFIKNYAEDQCDFKVFETTNSDIAEACLNKLNHFSISNRHEYNNSDVKNSLVRAGCEI